jgi:hypothetical protein
MFASSERPLTVFQARFRRDDFFSPGWRQFTPEFGEAVHAKIAWKESKKLERASGPQTGSGEIVAAMLF